MKQFSIYDCNEREAQKFFKDCNFAWAITRIIVNLVSFVWSPANRSVLNYVTHLEIIGYFLCILLQLVVLFAFQIKWLQSITHSTINSGSASFFALLLFWTLTVILSQYSFHEDWKHIDRRRRKFYKTFVLTNFL